MTSPTALLHASLPLTLLVFGAAIAQADAPATTGGAKIFLRANSDGDASHLIGRFFPDALPNERLREEDAIQTRCSAFIQAKLVPASGTSEEVLPGQRRVAWTLDAKLVADIDEKGLLACCAAHPDQCPRRYIDSALKGDFFDRSLNGERELIRETTGSQFFAFTVGATLRASSRCDPGCSWAKEIPKSLDGRYFVGLSSGALDPQAARDAAFGDAKRQAGESLTAIFALARAEVERQSGPVELTLADQRQIDAERARIAGQLTAECVCAPAGRAPSAAIQVLAHLPSSAAEAARQTARAFYDQRSAGAVARFNEAALDALLTLAPGGRTALPTAIDKVLDGNTPGGQRADWAVTQMRAAISKKPDRLVLKEIPASWAGDGLPPGIELLLSAQIVERGDQLEVAWSARALDPTHGQRLIQGRPVAIPASLAPEVEILRAGELPPSGQGLSIRLQSPASGSLCPGETTALRIHARERRHLQIWNLYGKGQSKAVLVYPTAPGEGIIEAGQTITLDGLVALPTEGATDERFLAIAAPTAEDLGALAAFRGCRLNKKRARALLDAQRLKASGRLSMAVDGYRISPDRRCEAFDPPSLQEAERLIESIPPCP